MVKSRTNNSIRNAYFIVGSKILQIVLAFGFRTILIAYIGLAVLGLDGLFSSVIGILNMADLGISAAIVFSLYKPLANDDKCKINALMTFFQKFYIFVGFFVLIIGLMLLPVLPYIVNVPNNTQDIELIYILTLVGTSVTYFLSSRRILFEADQENFRITIIDTVTNVIVQITQTIVLFLTKNYILVLILRIACSMGTNLFIYIYAKMKYPLLNKSFKSKLTKEDRKELFKNTSAVMVHKLGGVLVMGTDNLIISIMIGTLSVGVYANYLLIINNISIIITMLLAALTPSIGNLKATSDDIEKHYKIFKVVNGLGFMAAAFSAICLFTLMRPFILVWIGASYIFPVGIELLLCVNFFIATMRYPIGAFCTAGGYFKQTLYKPILEGVINLIVSITLTNFIGIAGVFIGTTASLVLGSLWVDPRITFKLWFKKSPLSYFAFYGAGLLITACVGGICYFLTTLFTLSNGWLDLFVKAIMVIGISGVTLFLTMIKSQSVKFVANQLKSKFKK